MKLVNPEPYLLEALRLDQGLLSDFAIRWIKEYCDAGECRLAYDTFIYEKESGHYAPSPEGIEQLRHAAFALGLQFPNLGS